ncbi:protein PHOTOSYSTEM I ASSEMBLY 2, chloroplastic [Corylus avellana]|uniref:protein PHOTOSYSTEM I ASSEMBLY 2, chloroplastic n=1 Tax=Corylus avellana TaxID=13451 RepID=UPI00286CA50F|nr:protein PHOTOSYSTEM I ASSEMBLY 2, chloroplastic [Corylus avellana]
MAMLFMAPAKLNFLRILPSPSPPLLKPARCAPLPPVQQSSFKVDAAIICEPCNGKGWLLCDFCKGQKTNVRAENKRIYRRCPSCRATGYILCSNCKVFKCVTFPNSSDGADLSF